MAGRLDRWLGVELRHLATLHAVADEGSFSRAAERLGYTQSAVSHQIAALERIVGVRLIDRPGGRKPVSLTEPGTLLLRHAHCILTTLATAEADMRRLVEGDGSLRVGTFQSVGARLLPTIMKHFAKSFPQTVIELRESVVDGDLLRAVEAGDLDLAFSTLPLEEGPFASVELLVDPFIVLVPVDSDLAKRRAPLALQELGQIELMTYARCRVIAELRQGLRSHGVDPRFVYPSEDNATIQAIVAAGMGAALLPRLAVESSHVGHSVIELDAPVPPRVIALAWRHDRPMNSATRHFVDVARRVSAAFAAEQRPLAAAADG